MDLKHLLREAKQRIPPVLAMLEDPADQADEVAESREPRDARTAAVSVIAMGDCPKLGNHKEKAIAGAGRKDFFGSGGFGGEM